MDKKRRALIFGNCQADAISGLLETHRPFTDAYDIVPIKPVYLMTAEEKAAVSELMPTIDLFVAQPVGPDYLAPGTLGLKALLPKSARTLLMPVAWFNAYNPDMQWLRKKDGTLLSGPYGNYHSTIIVDAYKAGWSIGRAVDAFNGHTTRTDAAENLAANFAELRRRETILDITISHEIERTFRSRHLFSTVNHPNLYLQDYVTDRILEHIAVDPLPESARDRRDPLGDVIWPVTENRSRALDLEFRAPDFIVKGASVSIRTFVEESYKFYRKQWWGGFETFAA